MTPARLALAALLLDAATASAQETLATLEAAFRDGPAPSSRARVRLDGPAFLRETLADAQGRAFFVHLRPGSYDLVRVPPAGAADALPCARRVVVEAGTDATITIDCAASGERADTGAPRGREGTTVWPSRELASLPRPADPWSVLRDVPGVVTDRVNVAGSETAQQSLLVSHGDAGLGATWTIDGFDVTDPAAPGFTSVYPDMDALETVVARTGATDARVRTPGVQAALDFRAPTRRLSGRGHVRLAPSALQSDNLPDALAARSFFRSATEHVLELGAEAGGRRREAASGSGEASTGMRSTSGRSPSTRKRSGPRRSPAADASG